MTLKKSTRAAFAALLSVTLISCVGDDVDKKALERRREKIEEANEQNRLRAYEKLEKDGYGHYDHDTGLFMWKKLAPKTPR